MRCSPATSIWSSPARRISRNSKASTPGNGTLAGKPAVMGGFWGSHMGLIDLLLESDGGKWRVVSATSEARPIFERVDNKNKALVEDDQKIVDGAEGRPRGDARLCAPAGRQDLGAALFLFRAGRRRSVGADRQPGADLVPQGPAQGRPSTRTCRCCRRRRPSRPAAAAAPTTTPTCRPATWRSRTSPTSTSIPTPCGRWRSPARRSRNGWRCRPASSSRSSRARPTRR